MAERNYDFTEIKTRIIIRNDSAENWAGSEVILEKGEPAIEYDAVNKTAKIKFGDGTSTFSELPFSTLTPTEINSVIGNISSSVSGMQFKGTVGTSGTVTDISSIQSPQNGDTYKIITGITLTSEQSLDGNEHELTVGDIIICSSDKWVFVPSGNEDITSIKIAGSDDTINVSTTAQTGEVVLGTAAGVNTATSVTNDTTTVPTTGAVKTYVDDTVGALENTLGTAATTNATDYATAAQGTKADNAMPKSGGTFTGDVTVSGDLTADNIRTSGEITITPNTDVDITTHEQEHDNSKITFVNSNKVQDNDTPISIESVYKAAVYGSHVYDTSILKLNANRTEINGDIIVSGALTVDSVKFNDITITPNTDVDITTDEQEHDNSKITFVNTNKVRDEDVVTVEAKYKSVYVDGPGHVADSSYLNINAGETHINGKVTLQGPPTENLHAATKKYVDDSVSSISTDSLIDGENILILNGGSATE